MISIANRSQSEWQQLAESWRQLGATHLAVNTMRAGFSSPEQHIEAIRQFKAVVD
jgi:hypothetical protein